LPCSLATLLERGGFHAVLPALVFAFAGVGTAALLLNGYLYSGGSHPGDLTPSITVTDLARAKHELAQAAHDLARAASTRAERIALHSTVYRDSPLVLDVQEFEWGLLVRWTDTPDESYEILIPEETKSELDVTALHQRSIDEFFATIERGGLIAFGTPPRRYHFTIPPTAMPQFDRTLARIKAGETLNAAAVCLNPQFLEDLTRAQSGER